MTLKEDYGRETLKRRYWPLPSIEFRAIAFLAPNSVELVALAADGKSLWLFDGLTGALKPLWRDETLKVTAIRVLDSGLILFGTFDGRLLKLSSKGSEAIVLSRIDDPILFIADEDSFVDSAGRLVWKSKVVLDDGVLQPSGLFHSKKGCSSLLLIKHRTIYAFDTAKRSLKTARLECEGVFCAAALLNDGILFVSTDSGAHFTFDPADGSLKQISSEESEDDDSENDQVESDLESAVESAANSVKSERIFSVIQNQNDALVLKVDSIHKHAWLETVKLNNTDGPVSSSSKAIPAVLGTVQVICPLCSDSRPQSRPLNASQCSNGHPLTICSMTQEITSEIGVFRCRDCNSAYSTNPSAACNFCSGLLTK